MTIPNIVCDDLTKTCDCNFSGLSAWWLSPTSSEMTDKVDDRPDPHVDLRDTFKQRFMTSPSLFVAIKRSLSWCVFNSVIYISILHVLFRQFSIQLDLLICAFWSIIMLLAIPSSCRVFFSRTFIPFGLSFSNNFFSTDIFFLGTSSFSQK